MTWTSIILIVSNLEFSIAKPLLVIWQTDIAKYLPTYWQSNVAKFTLAILRHPIASSSGRICNFNWIRGSKYCFLTSFSNLYCYFHFLVFLRHCYLLVYLHLSWLHGTPISHPVFISFVLRIPRCIYAPKFMAHITCFLKVRHLWGPGTRNSTGIFSPFRLLPKVSRANVH